MFMNRWWPEVDWNNICKRSRPFRLAAVSIFATDANTSRSGGYSVGMSESARRKDWTDFMSWKCSKADVWSGRSLEFTKPLSQLLSMYIFVISVIFRFANKLFLFSAYRPHVHWMLRILAWGPLSFTVTVVRLWFSTNEETPKCWSAKMPLFSLVLF